MGAVLDCIGQQRCQMFANRAAWLAERCGPLTEPPTLGSVRRPVLGDAPGTYVLEK